MIEVRVQGASVVPRVPLPPLYIPPPTLPPLTLSLTQALFVDPDQVRGFVCNNESDVSNNNTNVNSIAVGNITGINLTLGYCFTVSSLISGPVLLPGQRIDFLRSMDGTFRFGVAFNDGFNHS